MPVEVAAATGTTTMEITVSKFELLRELTATQGVVERKTTIPILSNYLFEASGDKLSLTATDLDLSLRTSCAAKVKKVGACTIPARMLHDYVKLLPDADITIKLLENHWVSIRCGRSYTKMVGMARANDPNTNGSQFFITFNATHSLDGDYTIFGHVTQGLDVLPSIKRGEPPATPTRMTKVFIVEK